MICLASKGRTAPAATALGSVAEQVLTSSTLPVLCLKHHGETLHLLDALLAEPAAPLGVMK